MELVSRELADPKSDCERFDPGTYHNNSKAANSHSKILQIKPMSCLKLKLNRSAIKL